MKATHQAILSVLFSFGKGLETQFEFGNRFGL
jgi:hypothetical protein